MKTSDIIEKRYREQVKQIQEENELREKIVKEFVDELLQYKQYVDVCSDGVHEVVEVTDIKFVAEKRGVIL